MLTTYAGRVSAHPTRTGANRGTAGIRLLIVHTSEGGELPTSAEALARFIATPRTDTNLASYHYIADTDQVIPVVPDNYVAYANAGANNDGLSICYPGKAGQTPEQWHDTNSAAMHEQVARWLADKADEYGIPLRKLTVAQVLAGERGVCGHFEVTLAYKRSTHTDPGPYYPWGEVIDRAKALTAPPPPPAPHPTPEPPTPAPTDEDDDTMERFIRPTGSQAIFACFPGRKVWMVNHDAYTLRCNLNNLSGHPERNEMIQDAPKTLMQATYPIVGPVPAGHDAWGSPL